MQIQDDGPTAYDGSRSFSTDFRCTRLVLARQILGRPPFWRSNPPCSSGSTVAKLPKVLAALNDGISLPLWRRCSADRLALGLHRQRPELLNDQALLQRHNGCKGN